MPIRFPLRVEFVEYALNKKRRKVKYIYNEKHLTETIIEFKSTLTAYCINYEIYFLVQSKAKKINQILGDDN